MSSSFLPLIASCQMQENVSFIDLLPSGTKLLWYAVYLLTKITFSNESTIGNIITFCKSAE